MSNPVLENLNEAQLKAVTQTDGPLLIIAGAGTGKTKVITSRILHLILEKKVPTGQILALTFTEKATEEMVERIDQAMPFSYEEVTIKTFHGFCDKILKEKGLEIGIDPGFKLLNQTQQWLFFKKNLFNFELDYYRPLGNPGKFFFVLLNHFSRLKDEDIKPDDYVKLSENKLNQAADEVTKEEAAKMLEVAKAYRTYQKLMSEQSFLDFGDLQFYALRLLEKRPSVLKYYQDRFKYILVDEFQDTNFAQNKLVVMLSAKNKNITVVGDDDQSIYKWRGASLSNILNFEKYFPNAAKILLTENYRSTQNILDFSYNSIQNNNPYRLEHQEKIQKKLNSQNGPGDMIEVWHFDSYLNEAKKIAEKIEDLRKEKTWDYQNFAVLVRSNQQADFIINAFKESGIPFAVRDTQGLLHHEEIKDILALLKFLAKPHDDIAFFRLLSLPIFNLAMRQILELTLKAKKADYEPIFFYIKKSLNQNDQQSQMPGFSESLSPFAVVFELFDKLLEFTRQNSVSRTIGEFLDKSGYYKNLIKDDTLKNAEQIQHIAQFLELAHNFENEEGENSVWAFLDYLESMEQAQGVIASLPELEKEAVSILTVHSSKGLEFECVFLPSLVAQRFPSTNRSEPLDIPEELIAEQLPDTDMHLQEERRLFYVASTRARDKLFLSYSDYYEGRKKWKISPFISEVQEQSAVEKIDFCETKKEPNKVDGAGAAMVRNQGSLVKAESDLGQKLAYLPAINVNQLSYSKLEAFKTCPLKYKFRYLFQIPSPSPHAANFGTSVHGTVNDFYLELKNGSKPDLDLLKKLYEKNWIGAGYENKAHEQVRKKRGWEVMEKFFDAEKKFSFKAPAFLERIFRLKVNGLTFTGRIDRIDKLDDGSYEVVDYKTGSSKKGANLEKDLQLSMYALACKDVFRLKVSKLSLYFLEDGEKFSTTRNDEDLKLLNDELTGLSNELMQSKFEATPGFHCGFCEYRLLCDKAQ